MRPPPTASRGAKFWISANRPSACGVVRATPLLVCYRIIGSRSGSDKASLANAHRPPVFRTSRQFYRYFLRGGQSVHRVLGACRSRSNILRNRSGSEFGRVITRASMARCSARRYGWSQTARLPMSIVIFARVPVDFAARRGGIHAPLRKTEIRSTAKRLRPSLNSHID